MILVFSAKHQLLRVNAHLIPLTIQSFIESFIFSLKTSVQLPDKPSTDNLIVPHTELFSDQQNHLLSIVPLYSSSSETLVRDKRHTASSASPL